MGSIHVDELVRELTAEAPCGIDLRYDPGYLELDRLAQGVPEQQVGNSTIPAVEPNWKELLQRCLELSGRTKDLRVIVYLCLAGLQLEGIQGLRDGLAVLRGLLERYWDKLHPLLDPEDNLDPLERLNIISSLCPDTEGYQDPVRFVQRVREAKLSNSRRAGRFSLRDIAIAKGEISAPAGATPPDAAVVEASFEDTQTEDLQTVAEAAAGALADLTAIEKFLGDKVGASKVPNSRALQQVLKERSVSASKVTWASVANRWAASWASRQARMAPSALVRALCARRDSVARKISSWH